jgi:hypothetical protein
VEGESVDTTIDMLEYGVPVEVDPPPPGKVIEQAEFDAYVERQSP